jgi:hypothetical protein
MSKYEEIKERQKQLITIGWVKREESFGGRYDFGSTTCSEIMWDDIQLLLKALELACENCRFGFVVTPDYYLKEAAKDEN